MKLLKLLTMTLVLSLFCYGCGSQQKKAEPAKQAGLAVGPGSFTMAEDTGANKAPLQVFYYRPATWRSSNKVVLVIHGAGRNASGYRDAWQEAADKYNLLIICPAFTKEKYPGSTIFSMGNILTKKDKTKLNAQKEWSLPVIDRVFAEAKKRFGAQKNTFSLYGHSGGAQFIHRYLFLLGQTKADKIVIANAGWYTMPNTALDYPYGIKNVPVSPENLAAALARPVTVLLGEADIDPNHKELLKTPEAEAQGINRFERGHNFFAAAKAKAAELGVPFNWQLKTVPGVAHSNKGMAKAAAEIIGR